MPLWIFAQAITGLRILAIPLVVYFEINSLSIAVFITVILVALTDILDGTLARRSGVRLPFGEIFDFAADSLFVISLFIWYSASGAMSPVLWMAALGACISYIVLSARMKKFARTSLGRWNGAIAMAGIIVCAGIRVFFPAAPIVIWGVFSWAAAVWYLLSIIENIIKSVKPGKNAGNN